MDLTKFTGQTMDSVMTKDKLICYIKQHGTHWMKDIYDCDSEDSDYDN